MSAPIQPGASRDPQFFVGRQQATAEALRWLRDGRDVSLTDPRRLGKTYWLRVFAQEEHEFKVVLVDYEGVKTAEEFLLRTASGLRDFQGLAKATHDRLKAIFSGFDVQAGPLRISRAASTSSPYKLLTDTIAAVEEHTQNTVVIAMDEVPIAIQSIAAGESKEAARQVLNSLRHLRQQTRKVRWIVAGSVGFHHIIRIVGLTEGALNDLETVSLGALTPDEADELGRRLLSGIGRLPGPLALETLATETSRIPFVMHRVALVLQATQGTGDVQPEEIAEAFRAFKEDRDRSRAVIHLVTRLEDYYEDRTPVARRLLSHLATLDAPADLTALRAVADCEDEEFQSVLDDLIDDHYLVYERERYSWRYDVIRRIWMERLRLR